MTQYHELAAHILGMKLSEIAGVTPADTGFVVTTHDGQHTLITHDGQTVPLAAQGLFGEHGPELDLTGHAASTDDTAPSVDQDGEDDADDADDAEEVPEGTIEEISQWVGEDPARAQRALDAERERAQPRSTLVAALDKLVTQP